MLRNVKLKNHAIDLSRTDSRQDSKVGRHELMFRDVSVRTPNLGLEPPASPKRFVCALIPCFAIYIYISQPKEVDTGRMPVFLDTPG